jgi:hypothetical protein
LVPNRHSGHAKTGEPRSRRQLGLSILEHGGCESPGDSPGRLCGFSSAGQGPRLSTTCGDSPQRDGHAKRP